MNLCLLLLVAMVFITINSQTDKSTKDKNNTDFIGIDEQEESQSEEYLFIIEKNSKQEFNLENFLQTLADQLESEEFQIPDLFGFLKKERSNYVENKTKENEPEYKIQQDMPTLIEKWPEVMHNFQPDDMLAFEIQVGGIETLYQDITSPTTIRGAFFIPFYPLTNKIDFQLKTLDNIILHSSEGVQDHIFSIEIKHPGEYKFVFANRRSQQSYTVNFALDVHNSSQGEQNNQILLEHLQKGDIDPFSLRLENLHNAIRVFYEYIEKDNFYETKFTQSRQEEGNIFLTRTHDKLLMFTILETMGVVAINLWQILYIKRILENKRLI